MPLDLDLDLSLHLTIGACVTLPDALAAHREDPGPCGPPLPRGTVVRRDGHWIWVVWRPGRPAQRLPLAAVVRCPPACQHHDDAS